MSETEYLSNLAFGIVVFNHRKAGFHIYPKSLPYCLNIIIFSTLEAVMKGVRREGEA